MRRRAAEKRAEYRAFFSFLQNELELRVGVLSFSPCKYRGHIFRTYRPADVFNINVY